MSVAEQPDRFLNAREPVCLVLVMPEKINFFINSRQRTYRFSVRLSDRFPNPDRQNRRFPCPVHNNNFGSRSLLTSNSRISAFK